jgi:hypothetical protein
MATNATYSVPRPALLFMSAVEEARATAEGPFRAIAPLFRIALEPQIGEIFNLARASSRLQPILGDGFTQHALEAFIPPLSKLGWLEEKRFGDRAAYVVSSRLVPLDEEQAVDESQIRLDRLYDDFVVFLRDFAPLLELTISKEDFQWRLFQWAISLDGANKDAIKEEATRLLAGEKPLIRLAFLDEAQKFGSTVDRSMSIELAGFVKWLQKTKRPSLQDVAALTELGLAYEFLDELVRPSANADENLDIVFVLDAPVLLDWLGLSGPGRRLSIETCSGILIAHGAQFVTLPHCLDELTEVLETVLRRGPAERYGLTGDAMRADPNLIPIARAVAANPDAAVRKLGIKVLPFRKNDPRNEAIFPNSLVDEFRSRATWHDPYKTDQKERDALSIAFVMRRRNGAADSDLFHNRFTLVTRNSTFTEFSKKFVQNYLGWPAYALGPAIETKTLAASVWMRFGSLAQPDLPRLHLIAACDRILASNRMLLKKALRKAEEATDSQVALTLLASEQAVFDLVVGTGGSLEVLDGANGAQIVEAMLASAQSEGREQERTIARDQLAAKERDISEQARLAAEARKEAVANSVEAEKLRTHLQATTVRESEEISSAASTICRRSRTFGHLISSSTFIFLMIISIIGQFFFWDARFRHEHPFLAFAILSSTVLTALYFLRFLPHTENIHSLIAGLLSRWRRAALLRALEPIEYRNRVSDYIDTTLSYPVDHPRPGE